MNANSGATLEKNTQPAAATFFAALANASRPAAAPTKAEIAAPADVAPQSNTESVDGDKSGSKRTVEPRLPAQKSAPQAAGISADANNGARPAASQPMAASPATGAAGGTNKNDRLHLSSTILAARIAALVVLPSLPAATPSPVTTAAPLAPSLVDENLAGSNRESSIAASEVPAAHENEGRSPLPAQTEAKIDEQSQATALKNANAHSDKGSSPAAPSEVAPASEPTDIAFQASSATATPLSPSLATLPLLDLALSPIENLSGSERKPETVNHDTQTTKAPDAAAAISSPSANAAGAVKASASQATTNSSVAGAGNTTQPSQHAPSSAEQPAPAPSRSADSGATPAQSIVLQAAPRESTAHAQADAPTGPARAGAQLLPQQTGDIATTPAINTARLIQSMSQTEMRVGMHSPEFGEISIRTAVSQQQMTAQISVDHGDLANAISTHIPAMQEKLGGETGLRALVEVGQGPMSFSGDRGSSSPRQQPSHAAPARIASTDTPVETDHPVLRPTTWTVGSGYRLDIRA
ncbi:MAG TPA: hypothetical protein VLZ50_07960 [Terracidiphilus sp.]|nr:hypothetical protein [Terracidiphilus sp.]